ncbi:Uncharacterized protein M6B38_227240 [Iris pallida]|uniref:Uncharacterized protein n=1 Tax=Iris pallida TaxID=29817 RepID=A0AAX6DTL2_IRIPA|nr:Uncharacterized protein M6B38_227240 [Iris pallida]
MGLTGVRTVVAAVGAGLHCVGRRRSDRRSWRRVERLGVGGEAGSVGTASIRGAVVVATYEAALHGRGGRLQIPAA